MTSNNEMTFKNGMNSKQRTNAKKLMTLKNVGNPKTKITMDDLTELANAITINNNDSQKIIAQLYDPYCCYCRQNGHYFRELGSLDENVPITCPVLLNTTCKKCKTKGHTTTRCPQTNPTELSCSYCKYKGHIKANCTKLANKLCNYCQWYGHVEKFCHQKKCDETIVESNIDTVNPNSSNGK
jgi:hypothetical protein